MASASLSALIIFIAWALLLMVLMEVMRSRLVLQRVVAANGFTPDNANLSPFMQRLARAHANCVENIPLFGGLLLVAVVSDRQYVTDPLAMLLLGARIVQSLVHLASGSSLAASLRFLAFAVQLAIGLYWTFKLLATA